MEFIPDDIYQGTIITWTSSIVLIVLLLSGLIKKTKKDEGLTETI